MRTRKEYVPVFDQDGELLSVREEEKDGNPDGVWRDVDIEYTVVEGALRTFYPSENVYEGLQVSTDNPSGGGEEFSYPIKGTNVFTSEDIGLQILLLIPIYRNMDSSKVLIHPYQSPFYQILSLLKLRTKYQA